MQLNIYAKKIKIIILFVKINIITSGGGEAATQAAEPLNQFMTN